MTVDLLLAIIREKVAELREENADYEISGSGIAEMIEEILEEYEKRKSPERRNQCDYKRCNCTKFETYSDASHYYFDCKTCGHHYRYHVSEGKEK